MGTLCLPHSIRIWISALPKFCERDKATGGSLISGTVNKNVDHPFAALSPHPRRNRRAREFKFESRRAVAYPDPNFTGYAFSLKIQVLAQKLKFLNPIYGLSVPEYLGECVLGPNYMRFSLI